MAQNATLLYGLGAAKSGTTWLHNYLASHPEAAAPPRKELHYFDGLCEDVPDFTMEGIQASISSEIYALKRQRANATAEDLRPIARRIGRLQDLRTVYSQDPANDDAYRRYYAFELVCSGAKVATDITPAYGILSDGWFARMKSIIANTRFVYIMRDPVDRLWSNIRMIAKNRLTEKNDLNDESLAEFCMNTVDGLLVSGDHVALRRGDYASTLATLDRNVEEKHRKVMFFEKMFSQESMDSFCEFLGISKHPAKVSQPAYAGITLRLDDARRRGLSQLLAPQYAAVQARYGTLPDRWQQNMTKV